MFVNNRFKKGKKYVFINVGTYITIIIKMD